MECKFCNNELIKVNYSIQTLIYCKSCGWHEIINIECVHNYILMFFILENGNKQLREFCTKCHLLTNKILSQKNLKIKLKEKSFEKYTDYIDEFRKKDFDEINKIVSQINYKKDREFHKQYYDYIESEAWKKIRKVILERDNNTCQICFGFGNNVHHLSYVHFENEYDFELVTLCEDCHIGEYHSKKAKKKFAKLNIPDINLKNK